MILCRMGHLRRVSASLILAWCVCAASSCAQPRPSDVLFYAFDGSLRVLSALDDVSASGALPLEKKAKLSYSLAEALPVDPERSLELEYVYEGSAAPSDAVVFTLAGEPSWTLPPDASFLGFLPSERPVVRYRIPVKSKTVSSFSLEVRKEKASGVESSTERKDESSFFRLRSVRVVPRVYGYAVSEAKVFATPFVYSDRENDAFRLSIEPAPEFALSGDLDVSLSVFSSPGVLKAGSVEFQYVGRGGSTRESSLSFPAAALPLNPVPLSYVSKHAPRSFIAERPKPLPFPDSPVTADPGLILGYRTERWRDPRYEIFRWEGFPSILIFDTADYAVQDRLFKRLAFFVEKAGFRGRLASDAEISALHGWNAHDYRAEDLAAFFESARKTQFPLNREERELERILLSSGLLRKGLNAKGEEAFLVGEGALVSISRESAAYLRTLFITHECFHGLFFTDENFRRFSAERYAALEAEPKKFLKAYFDSHRYDIKDQYLMTNELMAYCLQQPLDLVPKYFGDTLPTRLEKDEWRRTSLPGKETGSIPYPSLAEAFRKTAAEFDAYTASRWNVRAGRAALVYQISRTKAAR